jgi:hypothetical protein
MVESWTRRCFVTYSVWVICSDVLAYNHTWYWSFRWLKFETDGVLSHILSGLSVLIYLHIIAHNADCIDGWKLKQVMFCHILCGVFVVMYLLIITYDTEHLNGWNLKQSLLCHVFCVYCVEWCACVWSHIMLSIFTCFYKLHFLGHIQMFLVLLCKSVYGIIFSQVLT